MSINPDTFEQEDEDEQEGLSERERRRKEAARPDDDPDDETPGLSDRERRRKESARPDEPDDETPGLSDRERRRKEAARPDEEPDDETPGLSERERRRKEAARPDEEPTPEGDEGGPILSDMGPGSALERGREAARRGREIAARGRRGAVDIFRRPEDFDVRDVFGGPTVTTGSAAAAATAGPPGTDFGGVDDAVMDAFGREGRRQVRTPQEREARDELVKQSPLIDLGDVVFVERDGRTVATVDRETAETLARTGFQQEDFAIEGGRVGETGGGEDLPVARGGDPASIALAEAERNLEDILDADIDPRTDIEVTQTEGGVGVQLTDEGRDVVSSDIERQLEDQIEAETGRDVDLLPGDFRVTESGAVELTQQGRDKVATQPLTEFVEDEPPPEPGLNLPTLTDQFPTGPSGPRVEDVGVERDFGKAIGGLELPVFGERKTVPGPRVGPREVVGTITVDEAIKEATEALTFEFETLPAGEREQIPGPRVGPRKRVPVEEAPREHQILAGGLEEAISAPAFIPRGMGVLVDVGDFTVELATEAIDVPEFGPRPVTPGPKVAERPQTGGVGVDVEAVDRLTSEAFQVAENQAAVGAATAIEKPFETAARAGGALAGSALIFGGAAAVGPRTSLATRGVIQPGEEVLGFGGHALTRRTLGRGAAERAFPGKEPLIFSEEAFLRRLRAAGSQAAVGARRAKVGGVELAGRFDPTIMKRSDIRADIRQQIVEVAAEAEGVPLARLRGETITGAEVEVVDADFDLDEAVDVAPVEAEGPDPDKGDEPEPEGGGVVGGGGFDLEIEHETPSGVAIERVRVPAIESPSLELFEFETEAEARRRQEAVTGELFEGVGIEPIEAPGIAELGRFDQPFDPALETPGEVEVPAEVEIQPPRLELTFEPSEIEIEGEPAAETEAEREREVEPFPRERERFDRPSEDLDVEFRTGVFEHRVPTVKKFEQQFAKLFGGRDDKRRRGNIDTEPVEAPGINPGGFDLNIVDVDVDLDDIDPFD